MKAGGGNPLVRMPNGDKGIDILKVHSTKRLVIVLDRLGVLHEDYTWTFRQWINKNYSYKLFKKL
jgi:hypothetical protein